MKDLKSPAALAAKQISAASKYSITTMTSGRFTLRERKDSVRRIGSI
jgi:hypothetical protein